MCKITLEDDGTPPMKMQLPKGDVCTDSTGEGEGKGARHVPSNHSIKKDVLRVMLFLSPLFLYPFSFSLSSLPSPSLSSTDSTLPTSFSADVLLTSQGYQRPLSIFSLRPSMSMDASLGSEERRMIQTITQRPLSSDVRELKMAMGIGHFNK